MLVTSSAPRGWHIYSEGSEIEGTVVDSIRCRKVGLVFWTRSGA